MAAGACPKCNHSVHFARWRVHYCCRYKAFKVIRFPCILENTYINFRRSLEALSSAGGTAQESLSTVRTVYAFSAQKKLSDIYDAFISKACDHDMKFAQVVGVGMAIFSFIVYSSYSLSFYYGTTLLIQGRGLFVYP